MSSLFNSGRQDNLDISPSFQHLGLWHFLEQLVDQFMFGHQFLFSLPAERGDLFMEESMMPPLFPEMKGEPECNPELIAEWLSRQRISSHEAAYTLGDAHVAAYQLQQAVSLLKLTHDLTPLPLNPSDLPLLP